LKKLFLRTQQTMATIFLLLGFCSARFSDAVFSTLGRRGPKPPKCPAQTKTGYLKNTAGQYLTCSNESCQWQGFSETATQLFRQIPADPRRRRTESKFEIYTPSGGASGQCLNLFKNQADQRKIRMASCDLRGSQKWLLCDGFLGVDRMRDCVQSNAQVARCRTSHAVITMEAPKCIITSTTIDKLECMSPIAGGACAANGFNAGSMAGASSQSDCDACHAAKGSTQQCSFSFAYTTQNTVTQSWEHSFTWDIGVSFSVEADFVFGSVKAGMSFDFSHTLTKGKSTTFSTTMQDTTGCSVNILPGTRESAVANYLVGTIHADFKATVTRHYTCNTGLKKQKSYEDKLTLTISNVPTQKIVGTCTTNAATCPRSSVENALA